MKFIIVTGMSGAGKSTALKMLEDMGFYCVDNLPIPLLDKFAELTCNANSDINKVALGIDIRSGQRLELLEMMLEHLWDNHFSYKILFSDGALPMNAC